MFYTCLSVHRCYDVTSCLDYLVPCSLQGVCCDFLSDFLVPCSSFGGGGLCQEGVSLQRDPLVMTSSGGTPKQVVHILLECLLVFICVCLLQKSDKNNARTKVHCFV